MKLWISAETQSDAIDLLRPVRNEVEAVINSGIENESYDIGVEGWDCIVILMDAGDFEERLKFSKARRSMDFRLRLDYGAFMRADEPGRRELLLRLLLRSLDLLDAKGGNSAEITKLSSRIQELCKERAWAILK